MVRFALMNVDPEWDLETAFDILSDRHPPGSLIHGRTRNLLLQVWGELVWPRLALDKLDALIQKCGSRTSLCQMHRISRASFAELKPYFAGLAPTRKGRLNPGDKVAEWTLHRPLGRAGGSKSGGHPPTCTEKQR